MSGKLGCLLFVVLVAAFACQRGGRWEFGRFGIPEPIFDTQGRYPTGTAVDPVNLALVRSGCYQEVMLALILVVAGVCLWVVRVAVQVERERRKLKEALRTLHATQHRRKP